MYRSRWLAAGLAAFLLAVTTAAPQTAQARSIIGFSGDYSPGTIVVKTRERSLYYVLPAVIPGGSPRNPMGAAALTLSKGEYAIHGTNAPRSVGGFVSYGCIRMHNRDILDLFGRVSFGTTVIVTP
jgi:lipoprotein-anchoring transpeptidase ErfK/SrfK